MPASRLGRLVAALRYADFRVLWLSTVSNQLGLGMQQVLLGWLVLDMTGSFGMVGTVFAARSAPNLLVGLVAGAVTDRLDRRLLMRSSIWGMMLVALVIAGLLLLGRLSVWPLMGFTFVLGTMQAFYMTARQVYVYDIVGSTGAINGIALISLAQRLGGLIGSLITGGLLAWQGPGLTFLVMGGTYAIGALVLYGLRQVGDSAPDTREPMLENLLNYFRALWQNKVMLSLMISTSAAEVLGFSHQVMLPILAKEVLHVGPVGLGVLTAFRFAGGALGVLFVSFLDQVRQRGMLLLVILALFGLGQLALAQSSAFWMAALAITFINVMASATDILHHTLLQLSVTNEQRGRAMGSWIVGIGTAPFGQLAIGELSEATSPRVALIFNGVALAVVALVMGLLLPRLRRL
jgi:MFS family permease